jgi:hypothetical protein
LSGENSYKNNNNNSPICQGKFRFSELWKGGKMMSQIQERMKQLDIKQVDLIIELRKRGIVVQPPEMSSIIRGVNTYPKAKRVLDECDRILSEYERES